MSSSVFHQSLTDGELQSALDSPLTCPHDHCSYDLPFRTLWELDRHILAVHSSRKAFTCPYHGCYQGTLPTAFARPDKLTSHIKACHRRQPEALINCPSVGCPNPSGTLTVIAEHIQHAHLVDANKRKQTARCGEEVKMLRAVANAAPVGGEK